MTAAETKTTRRLRHRAAVDYRGLCLRWRLTDVPPRLCALTLTVIGELRLGLQVHAIASPPFAAYQKGGYAKPKAILAKFPAVVNKKLLKRKEVITVADVITTNVSNYIKRMGINISALSRASGVSDGILRRSIVRKERSLRADEAIAICKFLGKDPFDFYQDGNRTEPVQDSA